ncbi:hypothetical protein HMPREF0786_00474 [Staphylococcus capitis C87]|nr:hypothetical protein HMPREF0786_00474 [Staphylococcus capitis C87]GGI34732.1 hypothetical protein GCM10008141_04080 [Staphylococcus capitis]
MKHPPSINNPNIICISYSFYNTYLLLIKNRVIVNLLLRMFKGWYNALYRGIDEVYIFEKLI